MSDDTGFATPPGDAGAVPAQAPPPVPSLDPAQAPAAEIWAAPPPAMPPLGPPYAPGTTGPPPPPQFPEAPPEQWPTTPIALYGHAATRVEAPPRDPVPTTVLVVIAAAIGLLLGALAYSQTGGDSQALPTTTTTAPPTTEAPAVPVTPTTSAPASDLQGVIDDIKIFVENERGLKFQADPPVQLATDAQFSDLVLAQLDTKRDQVVELGQVLTGLGLVPPGEDVMRDERTLVAAAVAGFYDPKTKQLVVRGSSATPYVRQVLAHELTHALDDQHFGLDRPQLDTADDETGFGFSALTEGNARRVEDAYVASMSVTDQVEAQREQLALVVQHPEVQQLPSILVTLLAAPYSDGEALIKQVLTDGGQARLDAAFTAPPTTSEQVLEPTDFLNGRGPLPVAAPDPLGGAPAANRGVLGALLLKQVLEQGGANAATVIAGWGGDEYVTWLDGTNACVRDNLIGDDPVATAHLGESLAAWARTSGATVEQRPEGYLQITRCETGYVPPITSSP